MKKIRLLFAALVVALLLSIPSSFAQAGPVDPVTAIKSAAANPKIQVDWHKTWIANNLIDIAGTITFSQSYGGFELNPLVKGLVDRKRHFQFGLVALGGMAVVDWIGQNITDHESRETWYGIWAVAEFVAVAHNFRHFGSFRTGFPFVPVVWFKHGANVSAAPNGLSLSIPLNPHQAPKVAFKL
jgi:hypothetical protein